MNDTTEELFCDNCAAAIPGFDKVSLPPGFKTVCEECAKRSILRGVELIDPQIAIDRIKIRNQH